MTFTWQVLYDKEKITSQTYSFSLIITSHLDVCFHQGTHESPLRVKDTSWRCPFWNVVVSYREFKKFFGFEQGLRELMRFKGTNNPSQLNLNIKYFYFSFCCWFFFFGNVLLQRFLLYTFGHSFYWRYRKQTLLNEHRESVIQIDI